MDLLKLIEMEIQATDEYKDPCTPIASDEEVIQEEVSEMAKKLYTLRRRYTDETTERLRVHHNLGEFTESKYMAEVYNRLFWTLVNSEADSWEINIGIRTGFKLVKLP